jgi:hypothetical protein
MGIAWRTRTSLRHLDPVDVGETRQKIVGVPDERHADVGPVAVQHVRTRADDGLPLLQISELVHARLGDDRDRHGVREHVEEPGEGLLERELERVLVDGLDLVERLRNCSTV